VPRAAWRHARMSPLIFLGLLVGLVALAIVVNRLRGIGAHYLDDWHPEAGERILFRDDEADTFVMPVNRARYGAYARLRRGTVIVTDRRILAGARTLFGKKRMLQYMLYPGAAPGGWSAKLDGGLFTRGYETLAVMPEVVERVLDEARPYVVLKPSPGERSSTNVDFIRIYTDRAAGFPLPMGSSASVTG
jgi:hypothetical protein